MKTLCLPPSSRSGSREVSTCVLPIPLTLPSLPSQGKELPPSAAPREGARRGGGTSRPTTTHAAGDDFFTHPLPRAHRQCQREPTSSCSGGLHPGWIRPPAPREGQGAAGGTALPLGISEQDQLLAPVGRTTSRHKATEPTRTRETPSPVSQMHPPLLPPWGMVAGRPLLWGLGDAPVQRLAAASRSSSSRPCAAHQAHPAVPAEAPPVPEPPLPPLHRGITVRATYGCAHPLSRLRTDVHRPYAAPTPAGLWCMGWAAVLPSSPGAQARAGGNPAAPAVVWTSPAATPSGARGQAGAGAGGDGGAARSAPDAGEMGEQRSQKARRKPKSGDGDAGVRGGVAASESAAQTNSKRGRVSERCRGGREEGWGMWRDGGLDVQVLPPVGVSAPRRRGEKERRERGRGGWKKNQWKQIIPRHIRIKKLPAKTQNNHMVSVGSDGRQQRREARGDPGCCPPRLLSGHSMQGWMGAREGAVPLPRSPPEWLQGIGEAAGREARVALGDGGCVA